MWLLWRQHVVAAAAAMPCIIATATATPPLRCRHSSRVAAIALPPQQATSPQQQPRCHRCIAATADATLPHVVATAAALPQQQLCCRRSVVATAAATLLSCCRHSSRVAATVAMLPPSCRCHDSGLLPQQLHHRHVAVTAATLPQQQRVVTVALPPQQPRRCLMSLQQQL